ncbi:LytTR family DNA-binding domain-containing protein [Flectobacillus sp. DC10W]|jgi:DNA-binding LytR/AlgR family response regulator|uniref:LytTR family DNA-binding domain-containing protein n=1 Tax=Flectobacillus longus TaxID=2984207 RepID=A0ABT6YJ17_9BACT|nr:LytTR family DNA-binding domain-containing protein [Flectobacillus longus]MDI9863579.1 LytTR family DNA-binding domain-containing protein [Flectobacillus longus]
MIQKVLIIEDEKPNADRLERLIKSIRPNAQIVDVLECICDSIEWFETHEMPDVVMMDIRLSDGLSFEIFEKTTISCPIIFTTAYDEYAVKAFKYNSIDYLLKPVELDELERAFHKLENTSSAPEPASLANLLNYFQPKDFRTRFLLPYRDGYKSLQINDISYFYSKLKITRAKLHNGTEEIIPLTMEELEEQLNPKDFFRANRQFIIHVDAIEQIHNYFNGKLKIDLKKSPEDMELIVSREKASLLKAWLDF